MKKLNRLAGGILALSLLGACTVQGTANPVGGTTAAEAGTTSSVTVSHSLGETTVSGVPQKVVVFDYGILDMLDATGTKVAGVPQSQLPESLARYRSADYQNVGTLQEPDFEKLAEIAPDLILIGSRTLAAYEELSKLAPTVALVLAPEDYLGSLKENAQTLGRIFGKSEVFAEKLRAVEEQAAAIRAKTAGGTGSALILLANDGALSAYGTASRFSLIHALGFPPADKAIEDSTHGQNVSFEYVLDQDPDHIFVVDRSRIAGGSNTAETMFNNPLIAKTKAFSKGHIHYLDPFNWYIVSGGFNSTTSMLEELAAVLQ